MKSSLFSAKVHNLDRRYTLSKPVSNVVDRHDPSAFMVTDVVSGVHGEEKSLHLSQGRFGYAPEYIPYRAQPKIFRTLGQSPLKFF